MQRPSRTARARGRRVAVALAALTLAGCDDVGRVLKSAFHLAKDDGARELRPHAERRATRDRPGLLVLAVDGVPRAVLYRLLRGGELPGFARLLGGEGDGHALPHAHLDETLTATLPSSTLAAWATTFTGASPARHGVSGNEFFMREARRFIAPVPVSVESDAHVLETQSDSLVDHLLGAPTVYQQMRAQEPRAVIWVALSQVHGGADRFLLPDRSVLVEALTAHLRELSGEARGYAAYAQLDQAVLQNVTEDISRLGAPDVLTVYLVGTDLYAHEAVGGPHDAIARYLREVLDPRVGALADSLDHARALDHRYVVVVADHGHTEVVRDDRHSLGTDGDDEPAAALRGAGFTVRPFELTVDDDARFDAVLAYQGAMAYVYLADRSRCPDGSPCDWSAPPRYREDVVAAAEAFHRANQGEGPPALRGALDMIFVREPVAQAEVDRPFEVYLGGGAPCRSRASSASTRGPRTSTSRRGCAGSPWARSESARATWCCSRTTATATAPRTASTSPTSTARGTAAPRAKTPTCRSSSRTAAATRRSSRRSPGAPWAGPPTPPRTRSPT
ncbi:MAG: alkaline phosphatase family protein [Polyangiales bacterium]